MLQCRRFCSGLSVGMECFLDQVLLTLTIYWESKPRGKRLQKRAMDAIKVALMDIEDQKCELGDILTKLDDTLRKLK